VTWAALFFYKKVYNGEWLLCTGYVSNEDMFDEECLDVWSSTIHHEMFFYDLLSLG
jgi:hypothetical protein